MVLSKEMKNVTVVLMTLPYVIIKTHVVCLVTVPSKMVQNAGLSILNIQPKYIVVGHGLALC